MIHTQYTRAESALVAAALEVAAEQKVAAGCIPMPGEPERFVAFGEMSQLRDMVSPAAAPAQPIAPAVTALLASWAARAANAHPSDAMLINKHIRELKEAADAQVAQPIADMSAPTDLSAQLRDIAAPVGTGDYVQVRPQMLNAAAYEIERYYGGMMAWKQTAEKKDADWNAERMGRVNDRIAARAAAPVSGHTEPPKPVDQQMARWAIDGAIAYGRHGINQPPAADHWLMEYWQIGQQLAKLGATCAWDNVTPVDSAAPVSGEGASATEDKEFRRLLDAHVIHCTKQTLEALYAHIRRPRSEDSRAKVLSEVENIVLRQCTGMAAKDLKLSRILDEIRALASTTSQKAGNE